MAKRSSRRTAPVVKAAEAKAAEVKAAQVKAEVKAEPDKKEVKTEIKPEESAKEVVEKVKALYVAEGHRESSIKSLRVYMKPQEWKAYYVINDKIAGELPIF